MNDILANTMQGMRAASLLLFLSAVSACTKTAETPDNASASPPSPPPTRLDSFSREDKISFKFTYSPSINTYPVLVERLADETKNAMVTVYSEIKETVLDSPHDSNTNQYNLWYEMDYQMVADTDKVVAVLGDFSLFVEGMAHDKRSSVSHVWLPQQQQWLTAQRLIIAPKNWQILSTYVRSKLYEQFVDKTDSLSDFSREWIDKGAAPDAEHFQIFQPLMADQEHIAALRFIFPPYQVAAFVFGTVTVDVPAVILHPLVAAEYQDLFAYP